MRLRVILITAAALAVGADARGQALWDTPSFLPPRPGDDIGVYLTDGDNTDFGIQGIWRQQGNLNLGLRLGFVDAFDDLIIVGGETWNTLATAGPEFPMDVAWTLGVGAAFGEGVNFSVPLGLTVGHTFVTAPFTFQLYGHPRLALVVVSRDNYDDTDLEGLLDIGADFHLGPDWKLRLGFTVGGYDALGIGMAYRWGRSVAVR